VKAGSEFFTDEYNIYNFVTEAGYQHRTINHGAGEYARHDPDGVCVHCNTMEGIWSGLKNFLELSERSLIWKGGNIVATNTGCIHPVIDKISYVGLLSGRTQRGA